MNNLITVSEKAAQKLKAIIADKENLFIRVGIKGGGCSGFSYMLDIEKNPPTKFDYFLGDYNLIIDKKSAIFLSGTELDYESTLMKSGFVFKNPNTKSTCGCGSSFAV